MIRQLRAVPALIALLVWAGPSWAGTISGNVADYNAADVRLTSGVVTVPAGVAIYTATSTLAIGSSFTVTLPSGFTFGSAPSLTTSGTATFTLSSGGSGAQSATFTVATANVVSGNTISLATFTLDGATALETATPVASALPLTMQAIGTDASPLSFKAFASDVGATAVFVGAIQFIDTTPPANGTEFYATPDTRTAVMAAIAISPQLKDAATNSVAILGSNGAVNTLSVTDTATVTLQADFGGISQVFTDLLSDCKSPLAYGSVTDIQAAFTVPIGKEIFFCETAGGGVISSNPNGYTTVTVTPGSSTDFLSAPVNNEFPGLTCYRGSGSCQYFGTPSPVPTVSEWGMIGLAGMMIAFGAWKLKAGSTA